MLTQYFNKQSKYHIFLLLPSSYDMEMHMVHVEDRYISDGQIDWDGALADKYGIAVLAILFDVDDQKPQVITMIQFKKSK